ncbi:MAG: peptidoglycan-binding domain-containing protein [Pyrinomonadaceae bacterium]
MIIRCTTGDECRQFRFEGGVSAKTLTKSVGQGGFNLLPDTLKIQQLLNLIAMADGGPLVPLKEDSQIGPKTNAAIKAFQVFHQLGTDGRVDPGGALLKKMNDVPKNALSELNARLLSKITLAMPDVIAMAVKAQKTIVEAMDFLMLGPRGLFTKKKSFDLANLHFAFGTQRASVTISELQFIRTTYDRVNTVVRRLYVPKQGESVFGVNIFTIDPTGSTHAAYSPTRSSDGSREIPEIHSGHVYICGSMDTKPAPDQFQHIMFHELVHFVDDEVGGRNIGDEGNYRERAMRAPHPVAISRGSDSEWQGPSSRPL